MASIAPYKWLLDITCLFVKYWYRTGMPKAGNVSDMHIIAACKPLGVCPSAYFEPSSHSNKRQQRALTTIMMIDNSSKISIRSEGDRKVKDVLPIPLSSGAATITNPRILHTLPTTFIREETRDSGFIRSEESR